MHLMTPQRGMKGKLHKVDGSKRTLKRGMSGLIIYLVDGVDILKCAYLYIHADASLVIGII